MNELIRALCALPGVGEKSAQRIAYHLLQHDRSGAAELARALQQALTSLAPCPACNHFSADGLCDLCRDERRDKSLLCVVEMPSDLLRLEQTHFYHGKYFVLLGRVNPLSGMGAAHISLEKLLQRCQDADLQEVILATSFTQEGETTAYLIAQQLQKLNQTRLAREIPAIKTTRLARGVPAGAELEYLDAGTIAHALWDRHSAKL